MKKIILLAVILISGFSIYAQDNTYTKGGYAVEGYDIVSYFQDKAEKGSKSFTTTHEGVSYKFASKENLNAFIGNPSKYIPQYGGFCAYAIADNGKKIGINPKTYLIKDNKLYLFYNSWGVNTLEKWNEEGAQQMQDKADANWEIILKSQ